MKKNSFFFLPFFLVFNNSLCVGQVDSASIKVSVRPQKNPNWCYAAATEMMFKMYAVTSSISQEQIVNTLNRRSDCAQFIDCPKGSNPRTTERTLCNEELSSTQNSNWVNYISTRTGNRATLVDFDIIKIKNCIKTTKKPVIVLFSLGSGLNHAMIVDGYFVNKIKYFFFFKSDAELVLSVINPADQCLGCKMLMVYNVESGDINTKNTNLSYHTVKVNGTPVKMILPQK